jgi:hypothetical protein
MRCSTAVARLRSCAADLDRLASLADEPLVLEAWVFGELLELPEELDIVSLALVINLSQPRNVTCYARPAPAEAATSFLRFEKYPLRWFWRPSVWPVWNHAIARAVRFWSHLGVGTAALDALTHRRVDALPLMSPPSAKALREQLVIEHRAARDHLGDVLDRYDDRDMSTAASACTPRITCGAPPKGSSTSTRHSDGRTGSHLYWTGGDRRRPGSHLRAGRE